MAFRGVALDFDGVVLESMDIKTQAFRDLFADEPRHVEAIVHYHLANAGVSRFDKFRAIYRDILRRPLSETEMEALGRRFSDLVFQAVLACPFVPGALEFLERRSKEASLFIASATPQTELERLVELRGLSRFFRAVHGSPTPKGDILTGILRQNRWRPNELLFVGDAPSDLAGARAAGVPFVGRVRAGAPSPFPPTHDFPIVADLAELDRRWGAVSVRAPA